MTPKSGTSMIVTATERSSMYVWARDRAARLSAWPRRWAVFPLALLLGLLVMTAFALSGSSASLTWPAGSGPVAGEARPVRSDEWWVRTPMIVHQSVNGFPDTAHIGMGVHDQGVLVDLPTSHVTMLLRPHLWVYRVLPLDNAFAFEWWSVLALAALGPYALLWWFTRRAAMSALLSLTVVASPVVQWWTSSSTGTSIGYLCLGVTGLLAAASARGWRRPVTTVGAGWLFACAAAVPYPAWLLPLGLALAPLTVVGLLGGRAVGEAVRCTWKVLAGTGAVALVGAATYVLVHRDVLQAVAATIYPGDRNKAGGTGELTRLLGAPFYWYVARHPMEPTTVLGTNESEAAGPLFLVLPAAVAYLGALLVPRRSRSWSLASAALLGAFGLLVWFAAPIPASLGGLVGMDQVPPNRLLHTFAPVGAICLGLVVHALADLDRRQRTRLAVAVAAVVFLATAWAGAHFTVGSAVIPAGWALAISLVVAAACAVTVAGATRVGTAALAVVVLVTAVQTNPLQRGLSPLRSTPLIDTIDQVALEYPGSWVAAVDDWNVIAALVASGVDTISGASVYPDEHTWHILDPDESDIDLWNRYAHVIVLPLPSGAPTQISLLASDALTLSIDLCGRDSRALSVAVAIVDADEEVPACGTVVATTMGPAGELRMVVLSQG